MASTLVQEINQPLGAVGNYTKDCCRLLARSDPEAVAGLRHFEAFTEGW